MRLTLVVPSLSCGGAERAAVLIAEGLLKKGHQVSIVTLAGEEKDFYKLPEKVERVTLNVAKNSPTLFHAVWNNCYRIYRLRQAIQLLNPEVVISFLHETNVLTLLALTMTDKPVLVSEQNNPAMYYVYFNSFWDKLRRLTYPKAAKVVSSSKGVDEYFDWLPLTKRSVIYNPLTPFQEDNHIAQLPENADPQKKWVLAMGRLTYQKGFDILLSAFQKNVCHHPDWQLVILGEGELRAELENLRDDLGLTHQVFFPGVFSNPFSILKHSKLFVLSSRFEGFGNVLIEAMSCGLPVISTDCPSGPREIISDGIDGILVPNENVVELAAVMDRLMSDEEERQRIAASAPEAVKRFSSEKIVEMWEVLIGEVI